MIFGFEELVELNEWRSNKSLSLRVSNMIGLLIHRMYSKEEIEDKDTDPELELYAQLDQPSLEQEELALKTLLASRQTLEHQIESYRRLERSLQDQSNKQAQERR